MSFLSPREGSAGSSLSLRMILTKKQKSTRTPFSQAARRVLGSPPCPSCSGRVGEARRVGVGYTRASELWPLLAPGRRLDDLRGGDCISVPGKSLVFVFTRTVAFLCTAPSLVLAKAHSSLSSHREQPRLWALVHALLCCPQTEDVSMLPAQEATANWGGGTSRCVFLAFWAHSCECGQTTHLLLEGSLLPRAPPEDLDLRCMKPGSAQHQRRHILACESPCLHR